MKIISILNNEKIDNNELNNNDLNKNIETNNINVIYYIQFAFYFYLMCCIVNIYLLNNNMGCMSSSIFNSDSDNEEEKMNNEKKNFFEKKENKYVTEIIKESSLQYYNFYNYEKENDDEYSNENKSDVTSINSNYDNSNYEHLLNKNIYIECDKYDNSLLEKLITSYFNNDEHMNINNTQIKLYGRWNEENTKIFDNIFQQEFTNIINKTNNTELMIDIMEDVCLGNTSKIYILSSDGNLAYVLKKIKENYPHIDVILPWRPYISRKIKEYVTNNIN